MDDDCQCRALADTGNAQHQFEPLGQIVVGAKTLGNVTYLRRLACLEPGDVAVDNAPQRRLVDVLDRVLKRLMSSSICSRKVT